MSWQSLNFIKEDIIQIPIRYTVVTSKLDHDCDICKKKIKRGERCGMRITKITGRVKMLRKHFVHTKHLTKYNLGLKHIDINNFKSFFLK